MVYFSYKACKSYKSHNITFNIGENMNDISRGRVYGAATVGGRGQVVIPAGVRKSFKIKTGDKLIVFAKHEMIGLIPAEEFSHMLDQASQMLSKIRKQK